MGGTCICGPINCGNTASNSFSPAVTGAVSSTVPVLSPVSVRAPRRSILIETKTYRWLGHWTGDPTPYRTKEEVEEWKAKDPIKRLREYLKKEHKVTDAEMDALEQSATEEMAAAAEFALNDPEPDPAYVLQDVFYEGGEN